MGCNAQDFAKTHGISVKKIKGWFESGYLGSATKNEKTGVYDIPEDTPVPYNANKNVSTLQTLRRDILIAASSQQAIYDDMYPLFQPGTVNGEIAKFVEEGFVEVRYSASGAQYLHLCYEGDMKLAQITQSQQKKAFEKVATYLSNGATLLKAFSEIWPLIQPHLESIVTK